MNAGGGRDGRAAVVRPSGRDARLSSLSLFSGDLLPPSWPLAPLTHFHVEMSKEAEGQEERPR